MSLFGEDEYQSIDTEGGFEQAPSSLDGGEAFSWENKPKEWEWQPLERMEASLQESVGALWGAGAAVSDALGFESGRDWAETRSAEMFQKAADKQLVNTQFTEIDSPLDAGKYAVELITSFVPDLALMFAGGAGLGAAAGRVAARGYGAKAAETMLHKGFVKNLKNVTQEGVEGLTKDQVYKEAIKRTVADTGRLVGVAGMEGMQGAGVAFNLDREQRGEEANPWAAMGMGTVQSAISMLNPLNKVLAGRMPKGKANILQMTLGEASEEMGQEMVAMAHEAGINPDLTFNELISTDEGRMRLLESGVAGALLGTTFGGGVRALTGKKTVEGTEDTVDTEKIIEDITTAPEKTVSDMGIDTSKDVRVEDIASNVQSQFEQKRLERKAAEKARQEAEAEKARQAMMARPTTEALRTQPAPPLTQEEATEAYQPELPPRIAADVERTKSEQETKRILEENRKKANLAAKEQPALEGPEYELNREKRRKAEAAAAIEREYPTTPAGIKAKEERDAAAQAKIDSAEKKIKAAEAKVKATTNLKAKKKAKQDLGLVKKIQVAKIKEAKEEMKLAPKPPKGMEVAEGTLEANAAPIAHIDEQAAAERAKALEAKTTQEQKAILATEEAKKPIKGWAASEFQSDGKAVKMFKKDNSVIVRHKKDRLQLVEVNKEGGREDKGFFKSLGDAQLAAEQGKTSEQFYPPTESAAQKRKARALTPTEAERIVNLGEDKYNKILDNAARTATTLGELEAREVATLAVDDAAKTWNPETAKGEFSSYAQQRAKQAILDAQKPKTKEITMVPETAAEMKDGEVGETNVEQATKADVDTEAATKITKVEAEKVEAAPAKKVSKEEYIAEQEAKKKKIEEAKKKKQEIADAELKKAREAETNLKKKQDAKREEVKAKREKAKESIEAKQEAKKKPTQAEMDKEAEANKKPLSKLTDDEFRAWEKKVLKENLPAELEDWKPKKETYESYNERLAIRDAEFAKALKELPEDYRKERDRRRKEKNDAYQAIEDAKSPEQKAQELKDAMKAIASFDAEPVDRSPADQLAYNWIQMRKGVENALEGLRKANLSGEEAKHQAEAIDILEEDIAMHEQKKLAFKKKYPNGLALIERGLKAPDKITNRFSKFLYDEVDWDKLQDIKVVMGQANGYNSRTNTVTLTEKSSHETMIHEVVHAITVNEMASNPELKAKVTEAMMVAKEEAIKRGFISAAEVRMLKGITTSAEFQALKVSNKTRLRAYGFLNEKEFLSEAFGTKEFQSFLKTVKMPGAKASLWSRLMNWIGDALGIPSGQYTVLEHIVSLVPEISATEVIRRDGDTFSAEVEKAPTKTRAEQVKIMMEKDVRERPVDSLKEWAKKATDTLKDMGKGVTERLRKIDDYLIRPLRKMEFNILDDNKKFQDKIKDFVDGYNKMPKKDKLLLDLTLMNNKEEDIKDRNDILKKHNLTAAYVKVEEVLRQIHKNKGEVGLNSYKDLPDYYPRRVKDIRGLMQAIKEDPNFNVIQAELDRLGKDATEADKEKAIQQMIQTGRFPALALLEPSASKRRTIKRVSSEWKHFYENSVDSLVNHIYESNEAIHARKLFGDVHRKQMVARRDALLKELEGNVPDKTLAKLEKELEVVKQKEATETNPLKKKSLGARRRLLETKIGGDITPARRKKKVAEVLALEAQLNDFETEFTEGISQMLKEKAPNMTVQDADEVIKLIRGRLTQKGMHGTAATIRNISLMSVLSSPTSAITQIGDLAFSIYKYGPKHTVESILGKDIITPTDLDLAHSMKEFQQEGTAKWLDKTLKWSGLQWMDNFGKTTTMNAAYRNARSMSKEKFMKNYQHALQEDAEQTYKDIKAGANTSLSRYFVFNELSNLQPVSMSEMPLMYLGLGNGRIFYALKSYNIKAINTIYRESVGAWRNAKTSGEKAQAARNTGKLILLMTMAGATADEIKDWLLGKDAGTFSDNVHENLLKIAMLSRYSVDKISTQGIAETMLKNVLLPPAGFIDDPITDMSKILSDEPDFKTLNNLPWGKIPYSWLSGTEEKKDMKNLKKEITEAYSEGESFSSIRKRLNTYNAWARVEKESPLTVSSLGRARKKAREEERKS